MLCRRQLLCCNDVRSPAQTRALNVRVAGGTCCKSYAQPQKNVPSILRADSGSKNRVDSKNQNENLKYTELSEDSDVFVKKDFFEILEILILTTVHFLKKFYFRNPS
jgi:hypothetical protein